MPVLKDWISSNGKRRRLPSWQSWELELLNYWKQEGISNPEIALRFGVTLSSITSKLHKEKIRRYINWKEEKTNLKLLVLKGHSVKSIAEIYNVEPKDIFYFFKKYKIITPHQWKTYQSSAEKGTALWL